MKFKSNRSFALFLSFIYMLSLLPLNVLAESPNDAESSLISCGDFESEGCLDLWSGGVRDNSAAYMGDWGIVVQNPYGDVNTSYFGHILEYNDYIHLEEGKFYTFSACIASPLSDNLSAPTASAYLGKGGDELYIDISSAGFDWGCVTASFMATEDTYCKLFISCEGGDMDLGFFADCITITEETKIPSYASIDGPDSVFIPENGALSYRYSIVAYSSDNTKVNILMDSADFKIDNLPEGVDFDCETGTLVVYSTAPNNVEMVISCKASAGIELGSSSVTVITTKNLLSDPDFENDMEMWASDYPMDYTDGCISLYAGEPGEYGKYVSITYTNQLLLVEGKMYVFHADVKSSDEYASSSVYISNLSFASSGYAEINITGIGGEWNRVTSAFMVEATGLYDLTINLYAPTERPIFLDNVYLGVEEPAPTAITIRAPGNICSPSSAIVLPCYGEVLNQLGEVMEGLNPTLSVFPENRGVYLTDGEIVIEHGAKLDDYTVFAQYGDITSQHTVTVSDNFVGDGSFEEKEANEWWTASDGSNFTIVDYDGDKSGHVYSPSSSCLVINNSYMELVEGEYYVFSSAAGFGDCSVTAFIADGYTGEYIPFGMFNPQDDVKIPFSLDKTTVGRLVLYVEAEDFVALFLDDVEIVPCDLSAVEIAVTGENGDYLHGNYTYVNNMTDDPDADISATRWYISPSYDGTYQPIGVPNQDHLKITEDMKGQYIVYEVTPICSYTGLMSAPVRSLPVLISSDNIQLDANERLLSEMVPVEPEYTRVHPFTDITSHWGEAMIATLCASGIVSGKSDNKFDPDSFITRAEFTAMVARAFSLVSLPYTGQFTDVKETDWYSGWIEAAYKRGLIFGINESEFAPGEYITREQMAAIIYRAYILCNGPMPNDLSLRYYDSYMISPYSYEAVKNCTNLNILTGSDMNLFKPGGNTTRAEAAAALYRTLKCFY